MFALARPLTQALVAASLCTLGACASSSASRPSSAERDAARPELKASAVTTLSREDLDHAHATRVEEMLIGRVPGLEVVQNGSGDYTLRIRGMQSFNGSDEPLVVLDGMPTRHGWLAQTLRMIEPADVARIDVLKDAGATAAYGIRGAAGVILITTRRHN